jgi:hypothetical protein
VVWAPAATAGSLPPVGAKLASCNGKSADEIARTRLDRYQGNLDLATDRYRTAAYLLVDVGNPFVPAPPTTCAFDVGGRVVRYALDYRAPDESELISALSASAPTISAPLSLTRFQKGGYWLRIASLNNDQDWTSFFKDVETNRTALRSAPLIVIDLRGNGGGSSSYANRLARIIWGEDFVDQHTPAQRSDIWRVSSANRMWLEWVIGELQDDPDSAAERAYYRNLLSLMDDARRRGSPIFVFRDPAGSAVSREADPAPNPVAGKVVLFTDRACNSACLDLMDLYLRLPNAVHAGTETYADTIFMEETRVPLPSGKMTLVFGHKAITGRERKSNQTYKPSSKYIFTGNPADDSQVRSWVLRASQMRLQLLRKRVKSASGGPSNESRAVARPSCRHAYFRALRRPALSLEPTCRAVWGHCAALLCTGVDGAGSSNSLGRQQRLGGSGSARRCDADA